MRPTSVIFLIISILLACIGGMLCLSAVSKAEETGEVLFESVKTEDGNYVKTVYYGLQEGESADNSSSKNNIKKMEFDLENVDVEIRGGQDVNKIELYNFTEGMYSYATSVGGALTFEDLNGLLKMISFGTSGINFKGFRNLLFYREYANLDRKMIIYIKEGSNITNISCSVKAGSISVSGLSVATDITVSSDSGDVVIDGIAQHSSLDINVKSGSVSVKNTKLYAAKIVTDSAPVDILNCPIQRALKVEVKKADVVYHHISETYEGFDVDFTTAEGRLMVDGELKESGKYVLLGAPDVETEKPETDEEGNPVESEVSEDEETAGENEFVPNTITISVSKGNITVERKEFVEPEVPEDPSVSTENEQPEDPDSPQE